jgi:hypothetical protein
VAARADPAVRIEPIPMGARRGEGGKLFPVKTPFDCAGVVAIAPHRGRAIVFDCKHCGGAAFPLGDPAVVKEHQIAALVRQGEGGAMAGLLVERARLADYAWLDWVHLRPYLVPGLAPRTVHWSDPVWTVLGSTRGGAIPFANLVRRYPPA